jgi:signal transduction histidine kinase
MKEVLGPGLTDDMAQAVGELLPDGLVVAGADARVIGVNARAEVLIRRERAELIGRDVREALPLQDLSGRSWWECTDPWDGLNIRTGHRERLLVVAGGPEILVTAHYARPGRNQPVHRVVLSMRDAEARRRAERDQAALLTTVAHELRSPLTSVKGFSSTLLRRWDRFTDDQKRIMLETIEADADRVTRLITDLLDVSRLDTGRLRVHRQPMDIVHVLGRHVDRFVASGAEREAFRIEVHDDALEVWADPDRLDQILANLIENALKHGEGLVTVSVVPGPDRPEDPSCVDIVVSDDGPGIPPDKRELAFSRFWQGGERSSSGLGLYVVRGIAEAHGGSAVVDEGPGGARIRVRFPGGPTGA